MAKHKEEKAEEKSKRELFSGKVSWKSTSFVGGQPLSGTVELGEPNTEEGVFYVVQQGHPSVSAKDFSCENVEEKE